MGNNRRKKVSDRILHSQAREILFNVYDFMKREAEQEKSQRQDEPRPLLFQQVQKRVAGATGLSKSSVQRIVRAEGNTPNPTFSTKKKLDKDKQKI